MVQGSGVFRALGSGFRVEFAVRSMFGIDLLELEVQQGHNTQYLIDVNFAGLEEGWKPVLWIIRQLFIS